jgi:hypothetical protein
MTCWFSAKLRFVCLVESIGALEYMDSMYLLSASDFDSAFQRALSIGRSKEQEYLNGDGQRVRWRLARVMALDSLPSGLQDGVEVYSERIDVEVGGAMSFDTPLQPELPVPGQTI